MAKSQFDSISILTPKIDDFYYSKEGLIIFTENYHLDRGYCCESKCKHCPYGFNK